MTNKSTRLNTDQINVMYIHPKTPCKYYEYRKAKRFLFWKWKEGFYFTYAVTEYHVPNELISVKDKNLYYEGEVVYYKPHVDMRMSNENLIQKYFETVRELEEFLSSPQISVLKLITV
jgi:hypothetical protein